MTTTVPSKVPIGQARAVLADIATAANEHHAQTTLTRRGKPIAKVVHPDAGNSPHPAVWGAALVAFNAAMTNPQGEYRRAIVALGTLLRGHFHPDRDAEIATCVRCGAEVAATGTDTKSWVDGEGWDHCPDSSDSHQPAEPSS